MSVVIDVGDGGIDGVSPISWCRGCDFASVVAADDAQDAGSLSIGSDFCGVSDEDDIGDIVGIDESVVVIVGEVCGHGHDDDADVVGVLYGFSVGEVLWPLPLFEGFEGFEFGEDLASGGHGIDVNASHSGVFAEFVE